VKSQQPQGPQINLANLRDSKVSPVEPSAVRHGGTPAASPHPSLTQRPRCASCSKSLSREQSATQGTPCLAWLCLGAVYQSESVFLELVPLVSARLWWGSRGQLCWCRSDADGRLWKEQFQASTAEPDAAARPAAQLISLADQPRALILPGESTSHSGRSGQRKPWPPAARSGRRHLLGETQVFRTSVVPATTRGDGCTCSAPARA